MCLSQFYHSDYVNIHKHIVLFTVSYQVGSEKKKCDMQSSPFVIFCFNLSELVREELCLSWERLSLLSSVLTVQNKPSITSHQKTTILLSLLTTYGRTGPEQQIRPTG